MLQEHTRGLQLCKRLLILDESETSLGTLVRNNCPGNPNTLLFLLRVLSWDHLAVLHSQFFFLISMLRAAGIPYSGPQTRGFGVALGGVGAVRSFECRRMSAKLDKWGLLNMGGALFSGRYTHRKPGIDPIHILQFCIPTANNGGSYRIL